MYSRFEPLHAAAVRRRLKGASIPSIEKDLGVPRSTLSGWFKHIILPKGIKEKLQKRKQKALIHARAKAIIWHNEQKAARLTLASSQALAMLDSLPIEQTAAIELALAFLYLGEGSKKSLTTTMGNSDPLILKFFVQALHQAYGVQKENLYCELHLRADQSPESMKRYWSKTLQIPLSRFTSVQIDKRTEGTKTYSHYKGVCIVSCFQVAIQRKLVYIARGFCERVVQNKRG